MLRPALIPNVQATENIRRMLNHRHDLTVSINGGLRTADCGLRTTDCGLGIEYGLGIKRGLENTDWI